VDVCVEFGAGAQGMKKKSRTRTRTRTIRRYAAHSLLGYHVIKIISCAVGIWEYVAGMEWQQLVSVIIVAAAACGLLSRALRRRKFSFARDTHCGCSGGGASSAGEQGSIVFHARKGCRPEVIVKMR